MSIGLLHAWNSAGALPIVIRSTPTPSICSSPDSRRESIDRGPFGSYPLKRGVSIEIVCGPSSVCDRSSRERPIAPHHAVRRIPPVHPKNDGLRRSDAGGNSNDSEGTRPTNEGCLPGDRD